MLAGAGYALTGYGIVNTGNLTTEMWYTTELGTPDLNVLVRPGIGHTEGEIVETTIEETVGPITAPAGNNRIDLLQYTLGTGLNIKTGSEGATPSAPTVDANSIPIYNLGQAGNYLTIAMTEIVDAMIEDIRAESY
jgi:hypothetical protein